MSFSSSGWFRGFSRLRNNTFNYRDIITNSKGFSDIQSGLIKGVRIPAINSYLSGAHAHFVIQKYFKDGRYKFSAGRYQFPSYDVWSFGDNRGYPSSSPPHDSILSRMRRIYLLTAWYNSTVEYGFSLRSRMFTIFYSLIAFFYLSFCGFVMVILTV